MSENPSESPQEHQPEAPVPDPGAPEVNLYAIARAQRGMNLALLFGILSYVVLLIASAAGENAEAEPELWSIIAIMVSSVFAMACYIMLIVSFVKLSVALHGKTGCALALLVFIPCVNYLVVLILSGQATSVLRKHGLKVGLLGANPNDVPRSPG